MSDVHMAFASCPCSVGLPSVFCQEIKGLALMLFLFCFVGGFGSSLWQDSHNGFRTTVGREKRLGRIHEAVEPGDDAGCLSPHLRLRSDSTLDLWTVVLWRVSWRGMQHLERSVRFTVSRRGRHAWVLGALVL